LEELDYNEAVKKLEGAKAKFEAAKNNEKIMANFPTGSPREFAITRAVADARKAEKASIAAVLEQDIEAAKVHASLAKK